MKCIIVAYPDTVDTSAIEKNAVVSISDDAFTLPNGTVVGKADIVDPELIPHTHDVLGSTTGPNPA